MTKKILTYSRGVTLLGGGPATVDMISAAISLAPNLVCADGGANHLDGTELIPSAIIGDLDSVNDFAGWQRRLGSRLIKVEEQESTDFEKCLKRLDAPFFIGVGFLGGRQDHGLAAMHTLIGDARPIVLVGPDDVAFAPHREVRLSLPIGDRVSIFPLSNVKAIGGIGLKWPVDGMKMQAGDQIGTSNEAVSTPQLFSFDRAGAIVFLDPDRIAEALQAQGALFQPAI